MVWYLRRNSPLAWERATPQASIDGTDGLKVPLDECLGSEDSTSLKGTWPSSCVANSGALLTACHGRRLMARGAAESTARLGCALPGPRISSLRAQACPANMILLFLLRFGLSNQLEEPCHHSPFRPSVRPCTYSSPFVLRAAMLPKLHDVSVRGHHRT